MYVPIVIVPDCKGVPTAEENLRLSVQLVRQKKVYLRQCEIILEELEQLRANGVPDEVTVLMWLRDNFAFSLTEEEGKTWLSGFIYLYQFTAFWFDVNPN